MHTPILCYSKIDDRNNSYLFYTPSYQKLAPNTFEHKVIVFVFYEPKLAGLQTQKFFSQKWKLSQSYIQQLREIMSLHSLSKTILFFASSLPLFFTGLCNISPCHWREEIPSPLSFMEYMKFSRHGSCQYMSQNVLIVDQRIRYTHLLIDQPPSFEGGQQSTSVMLMCTNSADEPAKCTIYNQYALLSLRTESNFRSKSMQASFEDTLSTTIIVTLSERSAICVEKEKQRQKDLFNLRLGKKPYPFHSEKCEKQHPPNSNKKIQVVIDVAEDDSFTGLFAKPIARFFLIVLALMLAQEEGLSRRYNLLEIWVLLQILKQSLLCVFLKDISIDITDYPFAPMFIVFSFLVLGIMSGKYLLEFILAGSGSAVNNDYIHEASSSTEETDNSSDQFTEQMNSRSNRKRKMENGEVLVGRYVKKIIKHLKKSLNKAIRICNKHETSKRIGLILITLLIMLEIYFLVRPYHIVEFITKTFIMALLIKFASKHLWRNERGKCELSRQMEKSLQKLRQVPVTSSNYPSHLKTVINQIKTSTTMLFPICKMSVFFVLEAGEIFIKNYPWFISNKLPFQLLLITSCWILFIFQMRQLAWSDRLYKIHTTNLSNDQQSSCCICFEDFSSPELEINGAHKITTIKTECGHMFHYECLKEWTKNKPICPVDRNLLQMRQILQIQLKSLQKF